MQTEDKGRAELAVATPKLCNYNREKSESGRAEPSKEQFVTSSLSAASRETNHRRDRLTAAIRARPEAQKT